MANRSGSLLPSVDQRGRLRVTTLLIGLVVLLLGAGSVAAAPAPTSPPATKIFGGEPADIADLPSVVYVSIGGEGECTGTAIGGEWILTASHCLEDHVGPASEISVAVGVDQASQIADALITAAELYLHPDYDPDTLEADVALIRLVEPAGVDPIVLAAADAQPTLNGPALLAGWGLVNESLDEDTDVLRRGEMRFTDCTQPLTSFGIPASIHDRYVCATSDAVEACVGDSGGPLLERSERGTLVQHGVLAFGTELCDQPPHVSIYASVATYRAWIAQTSGLLLLDDEPEPPDTLGPDLQLSDIAGTTHEAAITALVAADITTGFPDGTFRPAASVTRGQMAAFLTRALDLDPGDTDLADTPGTTHQAAISALIAADITTGFPDGTFRPNQPVSRGQMAAFLTRALDLAPGDTDLADTPGTTHQAAISALIAADITTGFPDGTFRPDQPVSRGQMAAFLTRALDLDA